MFWTVLEIQVTKDGAKACIPIIYDDYDQATAKFFTICASASVNDLPYHAALILSDDGQIVKSEIFDRRTKR